MQTEKKRISNATNMQVIEQVQQFYKSPQISGEMPYMAFVKTQAPRRVMEVTIAKVYSMWQEKHPDDKVVQKMLFQILHPDDVPLQKSIQLNQCLRSFCTNILFKLQALRGVEWVYCLFLFPLVLGKK